MPMRKDAQIITPTPRQLKDAWEDECIRLKRINVRFRGRRLFPGNLLNGLVAVYLSKSPQERERLAREALNELLKWIDDDDSEDEGPSKPISKLPAQLRGVGAVKRPRRNVAPHGSNLHVEV